MNKKLSTSIVTLLMILLFESDIAWAETLQEAINTTLENNPQAQASLNRFQASATAVNEARSGYLPTVDIHTGIGYQRLDSPLTRDRGNKPPLNQHNFKVHQNSLSINQNLFHGFSTTHELEKSKEQKYADQEKLRVTAESLAQKVSEVYFDVLNSRKQVEIAQKNLEVHQRIHRFILHRSVQGISNESELYQIDGRLARAQAELIKTTHHLKDAESSYIKLTNQFPGELTTPSFEYAYLPESLDEAIKITVSEHPALLAMGHEVKSSEAAYDQSRSLFLPSVNLSVTKRWDKNVNGMEGRHDDTMAVVSLSYNLFSGGAHSAKRQAAAYRAEESRANQQETHRDILVRLRHAWARLQLTLEQEPHLAKYQDASQKTADSYKKQYDIGRRSLIDLLNSESESYQAEGQYTQAQYQVLAAQFDVLACMGQILNKLKLHIPTSWHVKGIYNSNN